MKTRYIVITIESLGNLLKDYMGSGEISPAAAPLRMMRKPSEANKLAIEFDDPQAPAGAPPLLVHFHLKRVHAI